MQIKTNMCSGNKQVASDEPLVDNNWFCTSCGRMGFYNYTKCPYCGAPIPIEH